VSSRHKGFWSGGEPFVWLTGGALTLALLLVVGLIALIVYNGMGFFWPKAVVRVTLSDGTVITGQLVDREPVPGKRNEHRIKLKVANRDLYGADFQWVDEAQIAKREYPADVAVVERSEWGLLIGTIEEMRDGGKVIAAAPAAWAEVQKRLGESDRVRREIRAIEKGEIGAINARQEALRLKLKGLELKGITSGPTVETLQKQLAPLQVLYQVQTARLAELRKSQTETMVVTVDGGKAKELPLAQVLDIRARKATDFLPPIIRRQIQILRTNKISHPAALVHFANPTPEAVQFMFKLIGFVEQNRRAGKQIEQAAIGSSNRSVKLPAGKHRHPTGADCGFDHIFGARDALSRQPCVDCPEQLVTDRRFG